MAVWRSKSGKMLIPIIAGVLILVALGGVAFMKFGPGSKSKKHVKEKPAVEAKTMVEMGEMVVNLADSNVPHYLKTKIVLEMTGATATTETDEAMPKMRDAVIETLSARSFNDLLSAQGKSALKESIKTAVNKNLGEAKVTDVFFSDFAMQ